jgi:hypothetical protein
MSTCDRSALLSAEERCSGGSVVVNDVGESVVVWETLGDTPVPRAWGEGMELLETFLVDTVSTLDGDSVTSGIVVFILSGSSEVVLKVSVVTTGGHIRCKLESTHIQTEASSEAGAELQKSRPPTFQ